MAEQNFITLIRDGTPARLEAERAAKLLGFGGHDISVLVSLGLLKPLGNPAPNAPKHFALVEILALAGDRDWLHRATRALTKHWKQKNDDQRNKRQEHGRRIPVAVDEASEGGQVVSAKVPATGGVK